MSANSSAIDSSLPPQLRAAASWRCGPVLGFAGGRRAEADPYPCSIVCVAGEHAIGVIHNADLNTDLGSSGVRPTAASWGIPVLTGFRCPIRPRPNAPGLRDNVRTCRETPEACRSSRTRLILIPLTVRFNARDAMRKPEGYGRSP